MSSYEIGYSIGTFLAPVILYSVIFMMMTPAGKSKSKALGEWFVTILVWAVIWSAGAWLWHRI
jgi:hypothetical protein